MKIQFLEIPFEDFEGTAAIKRSSEAQNGDKMKIIAIESCKSQKNVVPLRLFSTAKVEYMLQTILDNTTQFIKSVPKTERKKYGQFFTAVKTAIHMAGLFDFDLSKPLMRILDAGAGTGLLSAAVISRLQELGYKGHVHLVCYETDLLVLPILQKNLEYLKARADFSYTLLKEDYLLSQSFENYESLSAEQFDYIIGNPPYLKISKDAKEAKAMSRVCYGAPNLYFLFWAMGIFNLKQEGELVYIVPRSWTSGAYFEHFRSYLFEHCIIENMHLFVSRDKVFNQESVLQETMIVKVKKTTKAPSTITITSSSTAEYFDLQMYQAPYSTVVASNQYIYLVTSEQDAEVLQRINKLPNTLPSVDLRMKTGIVVDFRAQELLRNEMQEGAYPLFYSSHIKNGRITWPIGKTGEYIVTNHDSYLQPNQNYLFVKRFTSKEERRRLQCGLYRSKDFPQYKYISTQNKINYISCSSLCVLYGMFALLGSTLYDQYYRILNGSTQVNSTEINTIPVPQRSVIETMGRELMTMPLTEQSCNKIIDKWIN